jgi:hypothetical protein
LLDGETHAPKPNTAGTMHGFVVVLSAAVTAAFFRQVV